MSLRLKLVLALSLLAALATLSIGVFSYTTTRDQLHSEIDRSLNSAVDATVQRISRDPRDGLGLGRGGNGPGRDDFGPTSYEQVSLQVLNGSGTATSTSSTKALPVGDQERAVATAAIRGVTVSRDITIDGEPFRLRTESLGNSTGAVQGARSLAESERLLESLLRRTAWTVVAVIVLAALLGWIVARQITRRLVHLTGAAEEVASTGRLDVSVPVDGADEAARLGVAFNEMLAALARSKDDQQRLVQDAGHELRTPLTSLRTNLSVLRRYDQLSPETRGHVLDDLEGEARELTGLVNEIVELATEQRGDEPVQTLELGPLVERVAARTRRRTGREILVDADDASVVGRPLALERAVGNLVENAAKFDGDGTAPIEVTVLGGRVSVCDRGPGIDPADLPHLFDRFYRAVAARSRPGSGLGLSIVRDIVQAHHGEVFANNRDGGGACVGFTVPTV